MKKPSKRVGLQGPVPAAPRGKPMTPERARENAAKSVEARRLKRERELALLSGEGVDVSSLPRDALVRILSDPRANQTAVVQAAKALDAMDSDSDDAEWKDSVQVRPDYRPPTWDEVLAVARAAGAKF